MEIRRILTIVEQSPKASGPTEMRVATAAAIKNPLVESYEEDLEKLLDLGGSLGKLLAERVLNYVDNGQIVNVTKAALVGSDSVLEHAAALLHRKFSASVSGVLGDVPELLPSKKAQGAPAQSFPFRWTVVHPATPPSKFACRDPTARTRLSSHWQSTAPARRPPTRVTAPGIAQPASLSDRTHGSLRFHRLPIGRVARRNRN